MWLRIASKSTVYHLTFNVATLLVLLIMLHLRGVIMMMILHLLHHMSLGHKDQLSLKINLIN
jgi:hypothetical protein